jgi:hypothetical protein
MAIATTTPDVTTRKKASQHMLCCATLPRTLLGGTCEMRKAGAKYLPQEPKESNPAYANRLARTTLFNAYYKAVSSLTGKLFSEPVALKDLPKELEPIMEDVDGQGGAGRDFNRFLSHVVFDAMAVGLVHVLVDMPSLPVGSDGKVIELTVEQAKAQRHQPKWLQYRMEDLVSWRHDENGKLIRIVLNEVVSEPDGEWGETDVQQYRVLTPGAWEIYREVDDKAGHKTWASWKKGVTTIDFIPLVTIYASKQTGPLSIDGPLLEDLAYLNVAHWQSSSDQKHILHVARVPILFATGWEQETQTGAEQEIGPNRCIVQPINATLSYVEHGGKAIESGEKDLKAIEEHMSVMAMEPLVPKVGHQTATAKVIDTSEATSALQDIAQGMKDAVEQLLVCTGAWLKIAPENCGEAQINPDFTWDNTDPTAITELGKARLGGDISREAYLTELKRRKILSDEYDAEADKKLIDAEAPVIQPPKAGGSTLKPGDPGYVDNQAA